MEGMVARECACSWGGVVGCTGVEHPVEGGGVITMVLMATAREVESHPPASGDQGDEVGVSGGGSWGGAGVVGGTP
jgi:hypothetical protein